MEPQHDQALEAEGAEDVAGAEAAPKVAVALVVRRGRIAVDELGVQDARQ